MASAFTGPAARPANPPVCKNRVNCREGATSGQARRPQRSNTWMARFHCSHTRCQVDPGTRTETRARVRVFADAARRPRPDAASRMTYHMTGNISAKVLPCRLGVKGPSVGLSLRWPMVCVPVPGDVDAARHPYRVMPQHIINEPLQRGDAPRPADQAAMQTNR